MVKQISCPACGESEDLTGDLRDDGLRIRCEKCDHAWFRDAATRCSGCGSHSVVQRPQAMTQYSRGTQLSVTGWKMVPLCVHCDEDELRRSTGANGPIRVDYQPTAVTGTPQSISPEADT